MPNGSSDQSGASQYACFVAAGLTIRGLAPRQSMGLAAILIAERPLAFRESLQAGRFGNPEGFMVRSEAVAFSAISITYPSELD